MAENGGGSHGELHMEKIGENAVHNALGGGKIADILLWRNKTISASILGGVTAWWIFFELLQCDFIFFTCHLLMLGLVISAFWSNRCNIMNLTPPSFLETHILEEYLRSFVTRALANLHEIALGRDLKKLLVAIVGLWSLSVARSWWKTLFYVGFVFLQTVPAAYEKVSAKLHNSSCEEEKLCSPSLLKTETHRLFGRQRSVHSILGGGKTADWLLWRNKRISSSLLGGVTCMWILFVYFEDEYFFLVYFFWAAALELSFLWSKVFSPPSIPDFNLPDDISLQIATVLRFGINGALAVMRDIALGRDELKFCVVTLVLVLLSLVGGLCNLLNLLYNAGMWLHLWTLLYMAFVFGLTVPVVYEKYEDQVDSFTDKAMHEIKKNYVKAMDEIKKQCVFFDTKIRTTILKETKDKQL